MNIKMADSPHHHNKTLVSLQKKKKSTVFETQSKYLTDSCEIGLQVNPQGRNLASDKHEKNNCTADTKTKGPRTKWAAGQSERPAKAVKGKSSTGRWKKKPGQPAVCGDSQGLGAHF